jgi:hypothetical protein
VDRGVNSGWDEGLDRELYRRVGEGGIEVGLVQFCSGYPVLVVCPDSHILAVLIVLSCSCCPGSAACRGFSIHADLFTMFVLF